MYNGQKNLKNDLTDIHIICYEFSDSNYKFILFQNSKFHFSFKLSYLLYEGLWNNK